MPITPKTPSAVVTFPLHIRRDVWERFKAQLGEGESAHRVIEAFIEQRASGGTKRKTTKAHTK